MNRPPPGTIVDVGVVSRDYDDFYLIAHSSRMGTHASTSLSCFSQALSTYTGTPLSGTVKPTQYQIAYRTPGEDKALMAQSLQRLSFMLCHLYYSTLRKQLARTKFDYAWAHARHTSHSHTPHAHQT